MDAVIACATKRHRMPLLPCPTCVCCLSACHTFSQVVVVGGGYIGMEAAAGLRLHGVDVTVLMPEDRLMARILPTELAAYYET